MKGRRHGHAVACAVSLVAYPWQSTSGGPALAASFDCARATSPLARLICQDPVLSSLDEQLGRTYQERRIVLSVQGTASLRKSEQSWLHFITMVCPLDAPALGDTRRSAETCLQGKYRERLQQLEQVGRRLGPFLFNRVDLYAATPAPDLTGGTPGFDVEHVAYPQIDDPRSAQEKAWNKRNTRSLSSSAARRGSEDDDTDYEIGYATTRMISLQWDDYQYGHGRAHGLFESRVENVVLFPTLHPLTKQDVFGPGSRWVKPLQDLLWNRIRKDGGSRQPEDSAEGAIKADFIQPEKWLFSAKGLTVSFAAYEGGCYACTPNPVTATWTDLQPLLSHDPVIP